LPVDAEGFKGPIPKIAHMKPLQHFDAYVERKLFVHNMAHAAVSYLGFLRGHEYVWQGIRDEMVRPLVEAAMTESSQGLARRHHQDPDELKAHVADLIHRFHNRALNDRIDRVGRDPIRKLGRRDRLIGAAEMCLGQGVPPNHIAVAAAAAMLYDPADDPAAQQIQRIREADGISGVLREICGIEEDSPLHQLIAQAFERLQHDGWTTQR
jgi:mannitol-1-phosphate 5-dehydrogenase